jgi:hypothetical protein
VSSTSKRTIVFLIGRLSSGGYTAAASVILAIEEDVIEVGIQLIIERGVESKIEIWRSVLVGGS